MQRHVKKRAHKTLTRISVALGRKKLAVLEKAGLGKGFITDFARKYGVSTVSAYLALRGKTYKDIPGAVKKRASKKRKTA